VQTIIFEIVFHERTVIPDKTALLVGKLDTSLLQTCVILADDCSPSRTPAAKLIRPDFF
jgi:hypothetical protein